MGNGLRGVQESQESEVECHLVQPVGCCATAAVSLELVWHGWLGWLGCCVLSCCRALVTVAREASSSLILACMAAESLGNDLTKPPKPSCGPGLHGCYGLGP